MAEYITLVIFVIGLFVEIAPIKINPISKLGKLLNKEMMRKLEDLEKTVDNNDIDTVRSRILANEVLLRKGETFTRYQWASLYKDIDKWSEYHKKYPELNGIIKVAIENINEYYKNGEIDK